jgi:hypothetical protein
MLQFNSIEIHAKRTGNNRPATNDLRISSLVVAAVINDTFDNLYTTALKIVNPFDFCFNSLIVRTKQRARKRK